MQVTLDALIVAELREEPAIRFPRNCNPLIYDRLTDAFAAPARRSAQRSR